MNIGTEPADPTLHTIVGTMRHAPISGWIAPEGCFCRSFFADADGDSFRWGCGPEVCYLPRSLLEAGIPLFIKPAAQAKESGSPALAVPNTTGCVAISVSVSGRGQLQVVDEERGLRRAKTAEEQVTGVVPRLLAGELRKHLAGAVLPHECDNVTACAGG